MDKDIGAGNEKFIGLYLVDMEQAVVSCADSLASILALIQTTGAGCPELYHLGFKSRINWLV